MIATSRKIYPFCSKLDPFGPQKNATLTHKQPRQFVANQLTSQTWKKKKQHQMIAILVT